MCKILKSPFEKDSIFNFDFSVDRVFKENKNDRFIEFKYGNNNDFFFSQIKV